MDSIILNKTYDKVLNSKTKQYYEKLANLDNLHISDFAFYTPIKKNLELNINL